MTETLLEALSMGFDVSFKYRDVDDCYVVRVSRNKCYYDQVIDSGPWYQLTPKELITVYIIYGMERVVQQEEAKTDEFSEETRKVELDQDGTCIIGLYPMDHEEEGIK